MQELYLRSLEAIGIDPPQHDLRFVEDNWEGPTLGAWGTGWEVWLDGMEVTQFTYFQQVGGLDLDPISVELTYGLERLAMYLQGVDSAYDVVWAPGVTYGDVYRENERQLSTYNFEVADADMLPAPLPRPRGRVRAAASRRGLPLPAYDQVLKCSHAFNLLDARGAISVTDRVALHRAACATWRARSRRPTSRSDAAEAAGRRGARERRSWSRSAARSCRRSPARSPTPRPRPSCERLLRRAPARAGDGRRATCRHARIAVLADDVPAEQPRRARRAPRAAGARGRRPGRRLTTAAEGFARRHGLEPPTAGAARRLRVGRGDDRAGRARRAGPGEVVDGLVAGLAFPQAHALGDRDAALRPPHPVARGPARRGDRRRRDRRRAVRRRAGGAGSGEGDPLGPIVPIPAARDYLSSLEHGRRPGRPGDPAGPDHRGPRRGPRAGPTRPACWARSCT